MPKSLGMPDVLYHYEDTKSGSYILQRQADAIVRFSTCTEQETHRLGSGGLLM